MQKKWGVLTLIAVLMIFLAACASPTQAPAPTDPAPAEEEESMPEEEPEIDASAIFTARCARCHGADRSGNNGPALLPGTLTQNTSIYEATIANGSGPMPSFGSRLSADEISALVTFILSEPQ